MIKGLDLLGLAHPKFPLKVAIQVFPDGWALGTFDDPFGNAIPKIRKFLDSGKVSAVRIQAHWSNNHKIVPLDKLKKKLPSYQKLALDYPDVLIYVSHSCEYREFSKNKIQERVKLVRDLAPACIPVNSILDGVTTDGVVNEHHGDVGVAPGEIVSLDGTDISKVRVRDWLLDNKKAAFCFGWCARFNFRDKDEKKAPPPPKQRTKAPTKEDIKNVVKLMKG